MNYVFELLQEQESLLKDKLRFAEDKQFKETKQRLFEVSRALNKLQRAIKKKLVAVNLQQDLIGS